MKKNISNTTFSYLSTKIIGDGAIERGKSTIYELVNIKTDAIIYVGRTINHLADRLKGHFSPLSKNIELRNYLKENEQFIFARVIEKTSDATREKFWCIERAKKYRLFNKVYLIPMNATTQTEHPAGAMKQLDWLKANYRYLKLQKIEQELDLPDGTLHKWCKDVRPLPEHRKKVVIAWVKKFKQQPVEG